MFELTINGVVYQFNFGMGFMRDINKKLTRGLSDDIPAAKKNVGLQFAVAGIIDNDLETLLEVLDIANKDQKPRVTVNALCDYIDNECDDIDALFAEVLDFFKKTNATKKTTEAVLAMIEEEKAKAKAEAEQN